MYYFNYVTGATMRFYFGVDNNDHYVRHGYLFLAWFDSDEVLKISGLYDRHPLSAAYLQLKTNRIYKCREISHQLIFLKLYTSLVLL